MAHLLSVGRILEREHLIIVYPVLVHLYVNGYVTGPSVVLELGTGHILVSIRPENIKRNKLNMKVKRNKLYFLKCLCSYFIKYFEIKYLTIKNGVMEKFKDFTSDNG